MKPVVINFAKIGRKQRKLEKAVFEEYIKDPKCKRELECYVYKKHLKRRKKNKKIGKLSESIQKIKQS